MSLFLSHGSAAWELGGGLPDAAGEISAGSRLWWIQGKIWGGGGPISAEH